MKKAVDASEMEELIHIIWDYTDCMDQAAPEVAAAAILAAGYRKVGAWDE